MKKADNDSTSSLESRLKNFKRQDSKVDQKELEIRLAKLKGIDPAHYSAPPITVYQPPDTRTDVEKADSLLSQIMAESALDEGAACEGYSKFSKRRQSIDQELEGRLAKLRGEAGISKASDNLPAKMDVTLDSDEEADAIMERLLAEGGLPDIPSDRLESLNDEDRAAYEQAKKNRDDSPKKKKSAIESTVEDEEEELPWCEICNEDARLKCHDCDGDLYCYSCFK